MLWCSVPLSDFWRKTWHIYSYQRGKSSLAGSLCSHWNSFGLSSRSISGWKLKYNQRMWSELDTGKWEGGGVSGRGTGGTGTGGRGTGEGDGRGGRETVLLEYEYETITIEGKKRLSFLYGRICPVHSHHQTRRGERVGVIRKRTYNRRNNGVRFGWGGKISRYIIFSLHILFREVFIKLNLSALRVMNWSTVDSDDTSFSPRSLSGRTESGWVWVTVECRGDKQKMRTLEMMPLLRQTEQCVWRV